ncbi:MAG: DUF4012 domain-containing protein, partial [Actinomycetes bacterium]
MTRDRDAQRPSLWRWIVIAALTVVALCIPVVIWLGATAVVAAKYTKQAKSDISVAQAAAAAGDSAKATAMVPAITSSTSIAHAAVSGPAWWLAERVPLIGPSVRAITTTISAVDQAASGALRPLAVANGIVRTGDLRGSGGQINIPEIVELQRPMNAAMAAMTSASTMVSGIDATKVIAPVADQVAPVVDQINELQRQVSAVAQAADILPTMLGAKADQRYFVAFTSPAEARGGGGFLGTYGILLAHNGVLKMEHVGANTDLKDFKAPVLDLGSDYANIYSADSVQWTGMNQSAHFPFAAEQWITGWERQTGQQLQGAIALDPTTLSYIVGVTGPILLPDGRKLAESQVVPYLTNGIYEQFATDNEARKQYQVTIARDGMKTMLSSTAAPASLGAVMAKAASERHLMVYSTDPMVEAVLAQWPISGVVDGTHGPFAMLVVNNLAGNKADFFLDRSLSYSTLSCQPDTMESEITATLTNQLPRTGPLPAVVGGRLDKHAQGAPARSTRV